MTYQKELQFAQKLAKEAGKIMNRYFRAEDIGTTWKKDKTPVTVADTAINRLVIEEVKKHFPTHGVLGEEESYEAERDFIWVVDPIDGTVPFSLGMPVSMFLMALVDRSDGQPVVGLAYDPFLDHMYTAVKGQGSHLNGRPISASKASDISDSYFNVAYTPAKVKGVDYQPLEIVRKLREINSKSLNFVCGSYLSCKIATGEFKGFVSGICFAWDCAATALIVQEAGGAVSDIAGGKRRFDETGSGLILAANPTVLKELLEIVKSES